MADRRGSERSHPPKKSAEIHHHYSSSSSSSEQSDEGSNSNSLNTFANDGSFLERFKQMQEACQQQAEQASQKEGESAAQSSTNGEPKSEFEAPAETAPKKRTLPFVGKRRGGKVLKTGVVHKPKVDDEVSLASRKPFLILFRVALT